MFDISCTWFPGELVGLVLIHLLHVDTTTVCSDCKLAQYSRHTMRHAPNIILVCINSLSHMTES